MLIYFTLREEASDPSRDFAEIEVLSWQGHAYNFLLDGGCTAPRTRDTGTTVANEPFLTVIIQLFVPCCSPGALPLAQCRCRTWEKT